MSKNVTIMHVRQGNAKGLGHAVLCGRPLVGNEPFAVILPDVLLADFSADQNVRIWLQWSNVLRKHKRARLWLRLLLKKRSVATVS